MPPRERELPTGSVETQKGASGESQARRDCRKRLARAKKPQLLTSRSQRVPEQLELGLFGTHGADGDDIYLFANRWIDQCLLEARRDNATGRQIEVPHDLPQEDRLPRPDLHHGEGKVCPGDLQWDGRRSATRSDVNKGPGGGVDLGGGQGRLHEQAIDGLVRIVERRQVHPRVPALEKIQVREALINLDVRRARTSQRQPLLQSPTGVSRGTRITRSHCIVSKALKSL